MMHKLSGFMALLMLLFSTQIAHGQQQRFKAGIVAGLNACQIDGDQLAGYDKIGLRTGVRSTILLNSKLDLSFDILYSQRGAASKVVKGQERSYLRLRYVEVPIMLRYKDWLIEDGDGDFHRVNFQAGASYGRLINYQSNMSIDSLAPYFKKTDISFNVGATYFVNRHLGVSAIFSRSLNLLFNPLTDPPIPIGASLRSKFLSFEVVYMF